jgi:hypothetical protein
MPFGMLRHAAREIRRPPTPSAAACHLARPQPGHASHDYLAVSPPRRNATIESRTPERQRPPCRKARPTWPGRQTTGCAGHRRPGSRFEVLLDAPPRLQYAAGRYVLVRTRRRKCRRRRRSGLRPPGDVDRPAALFSTQPACENSAVPGRVRPRGSERVGTYAGGSSTRVTAPGARPNADTQATAGADRPAA